MTKNEASEMAQSLLKQYGQSDFEVSLGNAEDYTLVDEAFKALSCRTGPDGEFFVLKVYPRG